MTEKKESKFVRKLFYAVPVIILLYLLSVGPVFAFFSPRVSTNSSFHTGFRTFYAPLYYVAQHNRSASTLLIRYILSCEYFINPTPENFKSQAP